MAATKSTTAGCGPVPTTRPLHSLAAIVRAYRKGFQSGAAEELDSFKRERTVQGAIRRAAMARTPDGKRYKHQRRLSAKTRRQVQRKLARTEIQFCSTFDELHSVLEARVGSVRGVGELMLYDTALRIGARLRLQPSRVYLHRGTRKGARALGLNWRVPYLDLVQLPRALRALEPREIEDCLCIFKSNFAKVPAV